MMNAAKWGSNVQAMVPRNPYPLDWDDIKDDLKELVERVLSDGEIAEDMRADVANNFKMTAEECKIGDIDRGMCKARDCSRIFGRPAMLSPIGDAKYNSIFGCSHNHQCKPDKMCIAFGGNPICEHYTMPLRNKCRCMWIMDPTEADPMCGKALTELDVFDCSDNCKDDVQVAVKTADNAGETSAAEVPTPDQPVE